ncbi:MAG: selenocysteine-specific translation elongation factor [Planctomycetaceae bacterium]|nr:selenocysteine-specific translation elongation factor [Planctomycetaceae bacterium]
MTNAAVRHVIVGTAGHIDHGKTSLVGRLTGIDTDRLPAEKARGISIDLGFAHWQTDEFQFGVVDVPGHERFIRNMVAGATGVDLVLLVVAADDGVMPQTIEHLEIMDLLGAATGVVAITKCDIVDDESVELAAAEVAERLGGTFLEGCPIVPVSSKTGAGIDRLRSALVETARRRAWPQRGELFRMPIDRVFTLAGHGTIVTGTVLSGQVAVGDTLELLPEQRPVRVRSVQSHGRGVESGHDRCRTALNLAGVKTEELWRGHELATPDYLQPARRLRVRLRNLSSSPMLLKDRVPLRLHLGTSEVGCRLVLGGAVVAAGGECEAEIRTTAPVVAVFGQRFVLRRPSPSLTVAGGIVLDPCLVGRRRQDESHSDVFAENLLAADEIQRLSRYLSERDAVDRSPWRAAWKAGVVPSRYAGLVRQLTERGEIVRAGTKAMAATIHRDRLQALCGLVMKRIRAALKQHQPRRALPRAMLLNACRHTAAPHLVEAVFDDLARRGELVVVGENYGPADAQARLSKNQRALRTRMIELIDAGGLTPPNVKELAAKLAQKPETLTALLIVCIEDGLLYDVGEGLFYPHSALERARQDCAALLAMQPTATMSQLRETWGVTRKYSLPLCAFFDARQVTLREGDVRRAGAKLNDALD